MPFLPDWWDCDWWLQFAFMVAGLLVLGETVILSLLSFFSPLFLLFSGFLVLGASLW
jgi:hypothetical protein